MASESSVSRVYAQALVQIGEERGVLGEISDEFEAFHKVWSTSDTVRDFLSSPATTRTRKIEVINRVARDRFSEHFRSFLGVLAHRGRIAMLDSIHASFRRILEERGGILRVRATFAIYMEERLVTELEADLSSKLGKRVILWVKREPEILGGVVLQIGDRLVDMSLRNRLLQFRAAVSAGR